MTKTRLLAALIMAPIAILTVLFLSTRDAGRMSAIAVPRPAWDG